jgi:outer membrane lipoprotein carrier protein
MTIAALVSLLSAVTTASPAPNTAGLAASSAKLPLATVVDRLQKNYDQARDFRARFSQKYTNVTFSRTQVSTGEVLFKKPGRMRWNYETPEPKMFLSNGQILWLHEPTDHQAFKQDLKSSQLPAALAFLLGKGKLSDEFNISLAGDVADGTPAFYRLSLSPKKVQASYKSIFFIVDPKSFFVTESVLIDAQGNVNDITFSDFKVNTKLPDTLFTWTPPSGTRVIDAAKLSKDTGVKPAGKQAQP